RDFLFTAAFRRRRPVQDMIQESSARLREFGLHPEALLNDAEDYDYVMWAFVAHKSAFTGDPHNFPQQRMKRSHRTPQRILTETDPSTIQSFEFSASAKVRPWQTTNVTLLGDALHHMPPVGGMGGNAALNDANLLCQALLAVKSGQTLSDALHRC